MVGVFNTANVHSLDNAVFKVPVDEPCVTVTPALSVIPCAAIANVHSFCRLVFNFPDSSTVFSAVFTLPSKIVEGVPSTSITTCTPLTNVTP